MNKTHWKKLDNPNYLGAYSLMGVHKELIVEIDKVVVEDVKNANGTEQCKVAYLKGHKPMILNKVNCKAIEAAHGSPFIDDWRGKKITLYVAKIKAFGEMVDALRVKKDKPIVSLPELKPNHPKWEGAKTAIANGSVTMEAIKKSYSITSENENLLLG
jgi:hypothetical protein